MISPGESGLRLSRHASRRVSLDILAINLRGKPRQRESLPGESMPFRPACALHCLLEAKARGLAQFRRCSLVDIRVVHGICARSCSTTQVDPERSSATSFGNYSYDPYWRPQPINRNDLIAYRTKPMGLMSCVIFQEAPAEGPGAAVIGTRRSSSATAGIRTRTQHFGPRRLTSRRSPEDGWIPNLSPNAKPP